jgi:hypothetical protein
MKRVIKFIFTVSFLMIRLSYAQIISDHNTLSFSIGLSIPVGNFSSTDPSNNLSGYAVPGISANFSFNHKLNKQFGITAMLYGQRNGINTNTLSDQLDKSSIYPIGISSGSTGIPTGEQEKYYDWNIDKKYWYLESVMLGVTEEIPSEKNTKLSFLAKALIGAAYAQLPTLNGNSVTDTSYSVFYQKGASAFGFSYLLSAGMKYKLSTNLYFKLDAFYFGTSHLNFKNITQNFASTYGGLAAQGVYTLSNSSMPVISASSTTGPNKQPFGTINILAGIDLIL